MKHIVMFFFAFVLFIAAVIYTYKYNPMSNKNQINEIRQELNDVEGIIIKQGLLPAGVRFEWVDEREGGH